MIIFAQNQLHKKSRKYQITINNPLIHGFSHSLIKENLSQFKNIQYWCLCDEVGHNGTPHTHVYLYSPNAITFDSLQKRFYGAHIECAKGTHQENRDYICKEGKWADNAKHETNLPDTFEESGILPPESNRRLSVSEDILALIENGASNLEIVREHPGAMNRFQYIDATRQAILEEQYSDIFRDLYVEYLYGDTGVGKTRSIMAKYGYKNVYRITNYEHPFDEYNGQDVILFDEFRSDLKIGDMLKYLDGYPCFLPCRFHNKQACYTKVFVVSNIPFEQQYPNVQKDEPKTFEAFRRRFNFIFEMKSDNSDLPF